MPSFSKKKGKEPDNNEVLAGNIEDLLEEDTKIELQLENKKESEVDSLLKDYAKSISADMKFSNYEKFKFTDPCFFTMYIDALMKTRYGYMCLGKALLQEEVKKIAFFCPSALTTQLNNLKVGKGDIVFIKYLGTFPHPKKRNVVFKSFVVRKKE